MLRIATRILLLCLPAAAVSAQQAGNVTVYRCTDARGNVTLSDQPCAAGDRQELRSMQRPQDAPPAPAPQASPAPAVQPQQPAPVVQTVVVRTPQPMYECITPDGRRYTSDTGDGNPRWVPLWTLGYRAGWRGGRVGPPPSGDPGARRPPHGPPPGPAPVVAGGTWIRDSCHMLPQAEACARLRERRDEIRRRFFNAQESERNELRREERGINARLEADCG